MNLVLALLSAALLIACYPSLNASWLAPVALAPLMVAASRERRWGRRFWCGYAAGVVYWFGVCKWIQFTLQTHGGMGGAPAWGVFVLFCLAKALQFGAFACAAGWTMQSRWAVPATAALWVLIEYTNGPLGFAWLDLGNAAIDMALPLRLAPVTGVWGLSFLFAAIAAEIANAAFRRRGWIGIGLVLVPALFLFPALPVQRTPEQRATLVQPNIDEEAQWTPALFSARVKRMGELSFAAPSPLVIWPETPGPFYENDHSLMQFLGAVAQSEGADVIAGLIGTARDGGILNSVEIFNRGGKPVERYDKIHLVPFGEYVPWPLGPIAFKITKEAGDFERGEHQTAPSLDDHKVGPFICYESVFPSYIRGFVKQGAQLLVNPSNDGWFGKTAARYQHLQIVRMRAAENRRWILRATNDGISAAIDDAGRVRQQLPLYQESSAAVGFSYENDLTFYAKWGDWFVVLAVAMAGLAWFGRKPVR